MTSRIPPQCLFCSHWQSPLDRTDANAAQDEPTQICDAYPLPKGIPDDIWWNRADHTKAQPGDHGVLFEPDGDGAAEQQQQVIEMTAEILQAQE